MTDILVAPTERPPISNLGQSSLLTEKLGVDILWECRHGLAGAQRKEVMDLIASVRDGRLGKEFEQMKLGLKFAFLIVEGQPAWDREGNLMTQHTRWNIKQHNGVMLSAQTKGVMVITTRNALETCAAVEHLVEWTNKEEHTSSLLARPSAPTNGWGKLDDRSTAIHIYSGIPGINTVLAGRIYDAGIRLFKCGTTLEELVTVRGIGKPTAQAILACIDVGSDT